MLSQAELEPEGSRLATIFGSPPTSYRDLQGPSHGQNVNHVTLFSQNKK